MLLRGSSLRNTKYIIGIGNLLKKKGMAIFTGHGK
jgi:hypothetical protein